jgi:hypothetical protein
MKRKPIVNVSETERYIAGVLGSIVFASALRSFKPWRWYWAACLFYRACTGNCKTYEILGISTGQDESATRHPDRG